MAIYRNGPAPVEVQKYYYKKLFKLSSKQMDEEDTAEFFTNLRIYGYIQDRKRLDMKESEKHGRS